MTPELQGWFAYVVGLVLGIAFGLCWGGLLWRRR